MIAIPFILLIIIRWRTPKFEDTFYILKEQTLLFVLICLYQMVSFGLEIYGLWIPINVYGSEQWVLFIFAFGQLKTTALFGCCLVATYWVRRKCNDILRDGVIMRTVSVKTKVNGTPVTRSIPLLRVESEDTDLLHFGKQGNPSENQSVDMFKCLRHHRGVELFAQHLATEMSLNFWQHWCALFNLSGSFINI